jgi:DNA-directed RNA polymerase subunit RPC12/RpoP
VSLRCPECGAPAPSDAKPGRAYACRRCGNPVLAVEGPAGVKQGASTSPSVAPADSPSSDAREAATARTVAPPDDVAGPARSPTGFSWLWALVAFVVLGSAYVGAYQLLTAEARRKRAELLRLHGPAVESFPSPGARPPADSPSFRAWNDKRPFYDDRLAYEQRGKLIDVVFGAMAIAFGAQTAFTVFLALKARARAKAWERELERERARST